MSMSAIAATAHVSKSARLVDDIIIGRGAIIEDDVSIGAGCSIGAYTTIWAGTRIGDNNRIFPYCSLGGEPQDKKYKGEPSQLIIGNNNVIREYCFFNGGTDAGDGKTVIGDNNWIMGYVHIAHDCIIGNNIIISNCAQFGGHAILQDNAIIGGGALFHQFCRIGRLAMIGGGERVNQDIPPYLLVAQDVVGVNSIGLKRAGYDNTTIAQIKNAYRVLYNDSLPLTEAQDKISAQALDAPILSALVDFLAQDKLKLIRPK